jgi:hypothetical protein
MAAVALLLLAVVAWWLLRADRAAPPAPPPPPSAASAPPRAVPRPKAPSRRAAPQAPTPIASPRDELLEAIRRRAGDLSSCEAPPGSPSHVPVRLRIAKDGAVRALSFEAARPVPAPLAACVRERVLPWKLDGVGLASEVEVLVAFDLAPPSVRPAR